jgi:hypothetical protein
MEVKVLGISLGFPIIFALGIGVCPFHLFFYVISCTEDLTPQLPQAAEWRPVPTLRIG